MDQITDQVQPVSHPVLGDVRVVHRGRAAGGSRDGDPGQGRADDASRIPGRRRRATRRGPAFRALFTGAAGGLLAAHLQGFPGPRPWPC
jgi:hypothetical protein